MDEENKTFKLKISRFVLNCPKLDDADSLRVSKGPLTLLV